MLLDETTQTITVGTERPTIWQRAPSKMEKTDVVPARKVSALVNFRVPLGKLICGALAVTAAVCGLGARAAQLTVDARSAIPRDVQQIIVIDYDAMQNSPTAMDLRARLMPPELKRLETALSASGMDDNHDIDELAFASYRPAGADTQAAKTVGVAEGEFSVPDLVASFRKRKLKPQMLRSNTLWPMAGGMLVCFVNPTTMVFGASDAIKDALNARDGFAPNVLSNQPVMQQIGLVDTEPLWSVLDSKGTQQMMGSVLGQASQLGDYNQVKKQLVSSRYSMNFNNGVRFNLAVVTPDTIAAATMSSLMNAAAMYEKLNASATEKQAIDNTSINSSGGTLTVSYVATDQAFATLLHSSLFQSVVH